MYVNVVNVTHELWSQELGEFFLVVGYRFFFVAPKRAEESTAVTLLWSLVCISITHRCSEVCGESGGMDSSGGVRVLSRAKQKDFRSVYHQHV